MSRGLQTKGALNEVLAMPEWEKKVGLKFSARHWDTIEKVVSVLKVTSKLENYVDLFIGLSVSHRAARVLRTKLGKVLPAYDGVQGWRKELLAALVGRLGWVEEEEIYSYATLHIWEKCPAGCWFIKKIISPHWWDKSNSEFQNSSLTSIS